MLTMRCWTTSDYGDGVAPFGDPTSVLSEPDLSERVFRSLATWCGFNKLAYRVDICGDPNRRAADLESSLVEFTRAADGELVHVTYVKKPWNYMHVLHATADPSQAMRLRQHFIEIGRGLGRCENNPRDLTETVRTPPFYIVMLTGKLPLSRQVQRTQETAQGPSLVNLVDL